MGLPGRHPRPTNRPRTAPRTRGARTVKRDASCGLVCGSGRSDNRAWELPVHCRGNSFTPTPISRGQARDRRRTHSVGTAPHAVTRPRLGTGRARINRPATAGHSGRHPRIAAVSGWPRTIERLLRNSGHAMPPCHPPLDQCVLSVSDDTAPRHRRKPLGVRWAGPRCFRCASRPGNDVRRVRSRGREVPA